MNALVRDARYAVRIPGFTGVASLTLVVGLAAVNVIFAVVEAVVLRPPDLRARIGCRRSPSATRLSVPGLASLR